MDTWLFLGKWGKLSLLYQLARVYSANSNIKRQCVQISMLSFAKIIMLILKTAIKKLYSQQSLQKSPSMSHRILPSFAKTITLNQWIKDYFKHGTVVIFTDNPSFVMLVDKKDKHKQATWVYVRPACTLCALHTDPFFKKNDITMLQKADLIINDNQLNQISPKILDSFEQSKKIYSLSMPSLIFSHAMATKKRKEGHTAGFYGSIDAQVDTDLIIQSAMAMPSWKFELYITDGKIPKELKMLPNVFIFKDCTQDFFFSHWDMALLPYSCSIHHTCYSPPMLKDYVSHGIPITSTVIPAVQPFSSFVTQQRPKEPFARTILRALQNKTAVTPINFQQEWDHIATEINEIIQQLVQ